MEMKLFLLMMLGIFILYSCAHLYHEYRTAKEKFEDLGKKNTELTNAIGSLIARMSKLEEASIKRMPWNVTRGLEDVGLELVALISQDELRHEHAQALLSLVQRLRKDGTKYDAEKSIGQILEEAKLNNL